MAHLGSPDALFDLAVLLGGWERIVGGLGGRFGCFLGFFLKPLFDGLLHGSI
jgi:hypothetical protein